MRKLWGPQEFGGVYLEHAFYRRTRYSAADAIDVFKSYLNVGTLSLFSPGHSRW